MRFPRLALLGLIVCGPVTTGCGSSREDSIVDPGEVVRFATLPKLTQSHHPALKDELARIVSEQATPAQLAEIPVAGGAADRLESPDDEPQPDAEPLPGCVFPPEVLDDISDRIGRFYPEDQFVLKGLEREAARRLLRAYDAQRLCFRERVTASNFRFVVRHDQGLAADMSFVEEAHAASRLESLLVAELLDSNSPDEAIETLQVMFRIIGLVAREKHVVPRMAAVDMRAEALRVLGAVADHPQVDEATQRQLLELLAKQLRDWPDDKNTWVGDRAQGLHTYELLRDGYLLSILSYDDIRRYREEIGLDKLAEAIAKNIDHDELYYLKTMRRVIKGCAEPYHRRRKLFDWIEVELDQLRESPEYPLVADHFLLLDLESGHRMQALDRARCEAWWLALSIATGDTPKDLTNPLTGHRYVIDQNASRVIVDGIDPDRMEPHVELRRAKSGRSKLAP